jgi:hypothetical protein
LDIVRDFAQPDKVIGTKGVVESFEFPPRLSSVARMTAVRSSGFLTRPAQASGAYPP